MAIVTAQDEEHALWAALNEWVETREKTGYARLRPRTRSESPFSYLLDLWNNVLKWAVYAWREMTDEQKQPWNDNYPPQYRCGYVWFIYSWLCTAAGAGPLQVGGALPIGRAYIGISPLPQGVQGAWTVGYSTIGGFAAIA